MHHWIDKSFKQQQRMTEPSLPISPHSPFGPRQHPYTREEVLEWIVTALRETHTDEKAFDDEAIARLQSEYHRVLRDVATHQAANQTYIEEGVQLPQLAQRAHELFESREPAEKRRLLNLLLSNCTWKAGVLTAEYRQPFDMLALARETGRGDDTASGTENGQFGNWLPDTDSNRDSRLQRPLSYR